MCGQLLTGMHIHRGENLCSRPDSTQSRRASAQHLLISLLFPREFCVQIPFPKKETLIGLSWVRYSLLVQSAIAAGRTG